MFRRNVPRAEETAGEQRHFEECAETGFGDDRGHGTGTISFCESFDHWGMPDYPSNSERRGSDALKYYYRFFGAGT